MKNLKLIACCASLILLNSCQTLKTKDKVTNDCSAMFEIRDGNNNKISKKKEGISSGVNVVGDSKPVSECKILEVKIDDNIKCEIVGSDKIDNFSQIINSNKNDKIVVVAPDKKIRDMAMLANKYLKIDNINLNKYLDSDVFKNFNFAYKGMKCNVSNKKFMIWSGNKQTILTIE